MFPAMTKGGGTCFAFPDVCKVPAPPAPPIPTPFPNTGQAAQANKSSGKVKIDGSPALRKGDTIPMTAGDEGGPLLGVTSNKIKGDVEIKDGNGNVKIEGSEAAQLTSTTAQNGGSNANIPPGKFVAPSTPKVLYN